jgi:acyl-coenzyme A synthetase/AMP-(fatty) acid ligase
MTSLACARIGAMHSVVLVGFSDDALSQRIHAGHSKAIVAVGRSGQTREQNHAGMATFAQSRSHDRSILRRLSQRRIMVMVEKDIHHHQQRSSSSSS